MTIDNRAADTLSTDKLSTTEDTRDTEEKSCRACPPRPLCPPWWRVLILGVFLGSGLTLAAQTLQTQRIGSTVFDWDKLEARPNAVGSVRTVVRAPTRTLDELEMHITTLNPGAESHPPHQHQAEELLIVREGQVETLQNGKATRCGPGSIIFHASNDLHNIRNVGSTPATYHVIQWKVPVR